MKLEKLLEEMDDYNWDSVEDVSEIYKSYKEFITKFFKKKVKEANITFYGSVLDLCCGPVSFGVICDNVIGYDIDPRFIKALRKNEIKGIIGDVRNMPFEDKSFDFVVSSHPPVRPSPKLDYFSYDIHDSKAYVDKFIDDCIKIARKKVFISSPPIMRYLPKKHREKITIISSTFVVYDLTSNNYI